MERFPFLTSVLGIVFRSWIDAAKVKMPFTIVKDLGCRAEPFLLTNTSFGSAREHDLASSNRHSVSPDKSLSGRASRSLVVSSSEAWISTISASLSIVATTWSEW